MGKGSSTKQNDVTKERQKVDSGLGVGSSNLSGHQHNNKCTFSLTGQVLTEKKISNQISTGDNVVIVQSAKDLNTLEILINGKFVGFYKGENSRTIITCINQNYIYEGTVQRIIADEETGSLVEYSVKGFMRG